MRCLCCEHELTKRGDPATPERAHRALAVLRAMGWTREKLLAERARVDFAMPGLSEMIERGEVPFPAS